MLTWNRWGPGGELVRPSRTFSSPSITSCSRYSRIAGHVWLFKKKKSSDSCVCVCWNFNGRIGIAQFMVGTKMRSWSADSTSDTYCWVNLVMVLQKGNRENMFFFFFLIILLLNYIVDVQPYGNILFSAVAMVAWTWLELVNGGGTSGKFRIFDRILQPLNTNCIRLLAVLHNVEDSYCWIEDERHVKMCGNNEDLWFRILIICHLAKIKCMLKRKEM